MKKIHVVYIGCRHEENGLTKERMKNICSIERWRICSYRAIGGDGLWSIEVPDYIGADDFEVACRLRGFLHVYVVEDEDMWLYE